MFLTFETVVGISNIPIKNVQSYVKRVVNYA